MAVHNMLCLLPGPLAYSFPPFPVHSTSISPKPLQTNTEKCLELCEKNFSCDYLNCGSYWYNRNGWLGITIRVPTYLPAYIPTYLPA